MAKVGWAAANNTYQGANFGLTTRTNNTLKRELQDIQDALFIDHQDERIVDGGRANSIQFHFLLSPTYYDNGATLTTAIFYFDANEGATGSADWVFEPRRDDLQRRVYRDEN